MWNSKMEGSFPHNWKVLPTESQNTLFVGVHKDLSGENSSEHQTIQLNKLHAPISKHHLLKEKQKNKKAV